MNKAYLDHIGVAIAPGSRMAELLALLGLPVAGTEVVEREKVAVQWIPLPEKPKIELLEPTAKDGAIHKFLEKTNRDGVHHLSFRVENIHLTSDRLRQAGFDLVYSEEKEGADNCLVNFVHPKSSGGVLVEITQKR